MSAKNIVMAAAGSSAGPTYVDDVFSTYLYNGNGSTQTITNGIDLSGEGGMVWIKSRSSTGPNTVWDTARGAQAGLYTSATDASATLTGVTAFNSNGFTVGSTSSYNSASHIFTSWTFRKAPKFFDVVTYTGSGANRTIAHSLGSVPGMIVVKRTNTTGSWMVYHNSIANTENLVLNTTAAKATNATAWNSTTATASVFSLGTHADVNANGGTYVAYLFAHDTAADGLIQCGSFNTNNQTVNLGWEPQFLIVKRTDGISDSDWYTYDNMRGGLTCSTANKLMVRANTNSVESFSNVIGQINSTGFVAFNPNGFTHIYLAIRRPNKPPTTGTQVFQPTVYTGTNVDNRLVNTTIAPDMVWVRQRDDTVLGGMVVADRLRGQPYLLTGSTAIEATAADAFDAQLVSAVEYGNAFSAIDGFWCGNNAASKLNTNTTASNHVANAFKRAPGVFDVVCYTGNGVAGLTVPHSLGVAPELMIIKCRSATTTSWNVYVAQLGATQRLLLETGDGAQAATQFNSTAPTSSVFTVGSTTAVNNSSQTYVAYLFATLAGISKVGSYTGNGGTATTNGTSQTINCGFSSGARFVLIKRTDSASSWYTFDTARGIIAAADPYLLLNGSLAEVTTADLVDPDNGGFIVNQTSAENLNVTSATYIYLAIA